MKKYILLILLAFALAGCGKEEAEPFYQYYDENGKLQLELYYDENTETGNGIWYREDTLGIEEISFTFQGCETKEWEYDNPYSLLSVEGTSGEKDVEEYEVNCEKNEAGKIIQFQSFGLRGSKDNPDVKETVVKIDLTYTEQGTIAKREYSHNGFVFGSSNMTKTAYYDEKERVLYESSYITHGTLENYYIYAENEGIPIYLLSLDNYGEFCNAYFYKLEKDVEDGKWVEVPQGGENAFLVQAGLENCEVFREFEQQEQKVILYYDEKQEVGGGFLYLNSREDLDGCYGFIFHGCDTMNCKEVNPYSVFYRFSLEEPEVKYVDDWKEKDIIACEYEGDRLVYFDVLVSHGSNGRYYIYEGNSELPKYCLTLDVGWGAALCKFEE